MRAAGIAAAVAVAAIAAVVGAVAVHRTDQRDDRCAALPYRTAATARGLRDRTEARDAFAAHAVELAPDIAACGGYDVREELAALRARGAYDAMADLIDPWGAP